MESETSPPPPVEGKEKESAVKTAEKKREEEEEGDRESCGSATQNVVRQITQRMVGMAIDELRRDEMRMKIRDHIIAPLIKLIYCQMFPYIIVAAVVLLSGVVMWVLMFTMFALTFYKK